MKLIKLSFTPAKEVLLNVIQTLLDLGPDFTDKIILDEVDELIERLQALSKAERLKQRS